MGRHKTTDATDLDRAELFVKYVQPHLRLVKKTVYEITLNPSNIDDNYQECCKDLLRYIDTYSPKMNIHTWIITIVRRRVGKLDGNQPKYVDASKHSEHRYITKHEGYKGKYRSKKTKDFVNVYDDSMWKVEPNEMFHDGVTDNYLDILSKIMPNTDFGNGTYRDILKGIESSSEDSVKAYLIKGFYGYTVKDVAHYLNIRTDEANRLLAKGKNEVKDILIKINNGY